MGSYSGNRCLRSASARNARAGSRKGKGRAGQGNPAEGWLILPLTLWRTPGGDHAEDAAGRGVPIGQVARFAIYENTVGYYMLARCQGNARTSLLRVVRLPALHAILLGLAVNWIGLPGSPELRAVWEAFKGCYVVLGMLALGPSLARLSALGTTLRFVALTTCARFTLWPMAAVGLVVANAALGSCRRV